jgi:hypothetical protein
MSQLWGVLKKQWVSILPSHHRNSDYVGISKTLYGGDAIFLLLALSLMFLLSVFLSCKISNESFCLVLVISK